MVTNTNIEKTDIIKTGKQPFELKDEKRKTNITLIVLIVTNNDKNSVYGEIIPKIINDYMVFLILQKNIEQKLF